jgi:hypothetical protein
MPLIRFELGTFLPRIQAKRFLARGSTYQLQHSPRALAPIKFSARKFQMEQSGLETMAHYVPRYFRKQSADSKCTQTWLTMFNL